MKGSTPNRGTRCLRGSNQVKFSCWRLETASSAASIGRGCFAILFFSSTCLRNEARSDSLPSLLIGGAVYQVA